jgi:DNA-binding NarL/FixJ family response regulator
MSLARWATANGTHAEPAGGSIGQDAAQRPALVVIDAHVLTRSCLVKLLRTELAEVDIHELDAVSESGKASGFPVRLVALNIQSRSLSEPSVIGDLATLRRAFPHASVALLSEREDDGLAADALKLGISGVFPTTSTGIELAIAGLRLIMAGGIYVPRPATPSRSPIAATSEQASPESASAASGRTKAGRTPPDELTIREEQVLREVQRGCPNKVIAARLRMSENTVKMHVQHIMRKLGTRNRTETVLLWLRRTGAVDMTVRPVSVETMHGR